MAIEDLRKEATELGITFSTNIGEVKLQEKINAHYASQETSGEELIKAIETKAVQKTEEKSAVKSKETITSNLVTKAKLAEDEARKTKVITIIDNDQRVNNQTTSCTVNCGNSYFDLGTVVLPLNIPVEVRQGHINVLKEVMIPQHVKNPTNGLHSYVTRPRYSISYESN